MKRDNGVYILASRRKQREIDKQKKVKGDVYARLERNVS